jgi:hypothetical protein
MNSSVPNTNLDRILQQLAAYSNGTSLVSSNATDQALSNGPQSRGILTGDVPATAAPRNIPQELLSHQRGAIPHGITESGIKTSSHALESTPTHQSSFLEHLQKLEEITAAAARDSKKRPAGNSTPKLGSGYEASKSIASPNNILEWAPALRHVSRIGGPGSELEDAVKKV